MRAARQNSGALRVEHRRASRRPRVAFVCGTMDRYRPPFYERLRDRLDLLGTDLTVVYGDPHEGHILQDDATDLPWGRRVPARYLHVAGRELVWQQALPLVRDADLVVVVQQTKQLLNYVLLARQGLGRGAVAFWGHGRSLQAGHASGVSEWVKRRVSRLPHWWFAYNDYSAAIVRGLGYPAERVTSVNNAIDTRALVAARQGLDEDAVEAARKELGLTGSNVGLYCGTLYPGRRTPFLLEAARAIREAVEDFELVVLGAGADSRLVVDAAAANPWIHYVGSRFDSEKVQYFALARVLVQPSPVGLVVLDSFALEVPVVISTSVGHGPEVSYIDDGRNGVFVDDGGDPRQYAKAVAELLDDEDRLALLREGCGRSAVRYTVEAMADRFAEGILAAIAAIDRRKRR